MQLKNALLRCRQLPSGQQCFPAFVLLPVQQQVLKDFQLFRLEQILHLQLLVIQLNQSAIESLGFRQRPRQLILAMIPRTTRWHQQLNQKGLRIHWEPME